LIIKIPDRHQQSITDIASKGSNAARYGLRRERVKLSNATLGSLLMINPFHKPINQYKLLVMVDSG